MKTSIHLKLIKRLMPRQGHCLKIAYRIGYLTAFIFVVSYSVYGYSESQFLPDDIQVHGFLTQGFFHTSDNNVYGQSDDGISPGLTEMGLNVNYQPWGRLRFAAQGLYRRAGDVDNGSLRLDYGLADLTLFEHDSGKIGLRGGRIKIPFGLYNETRDVPFTHPTILLPQGIYFDRSRSLLLSADGGSFYAEQRTGFGDFAFKFNVGMPSRDLSEIKTVVLGTQDAQGSFETKPAIATQLSYELNGGEYMLAISYMDLEFDYISTPNEKQRKLQPLLNSTTHIQPLMFSAQYNGEKFTLTGEYDMVSIDKDDRGGDGALRLGFPRHVAYAKDWVFGLRWDITSSWMVRADYHRVHGTAWLPQADNIDPDKTVQDWDLYGLQLSFRF
jgi:hypothetical protein